MSAKIQVESFFSQTIQSNMTTSVSEVNVDVAPANTVGYCVLENGEANQEMIKWTAKAGLTLSGLLRGLSLTALTDTEVAGNKKTHVINDTIEITDSHYYLNDKVSNAAEEVIAGLKTFTLAPKASVAASATTELMRWDETVRLTEDQTIAGIKTFSSIPLLPASDPVSNNQASRKKYIDDQIATLSVPNIIDSHATYTPAYMTGGALAESNTAIWDSVSDGSARGTIDGVTSNVDGINFTASHANGIVTNISEVAARIQIYFRAVFGSNITVTWEGGNHFLITSVNTTSSTDVSVLTTSTGTVGTDISGVGTVYMDSEAGRGTATAGVLDITLDSGKLVKLLGTGLFGSGFIPDTNPSESITTGENVTAGNALRIKTDGLVYNAISDPVLGAPQKIDVANDSQGVAVCQIDTDKVIYIYHVGATLNGRVFTWSGEYWTAGTAKQIDNGAGSVGGQNAVDVVKTATDAFVVVQWDDGAAGVDDATAWACTVSGTAITQGLPTVVDTGTQTAFSTHRVCSPSADKITVSYTDTAGSKTKARTGTIVGTIITFGAIVEISATDSDDFLDVTEIGTDKVVTVYRDTDDDVYARVATISGTTMTQGAALEIHDGILLGNGPRVEKVSDDKFIVVYGDGTGAGSKAYLIVCTVSGTTITAGTPIEISSKYQWFYNILYWEDNKIALVYYDDFGIRDEVNAFAYPQWNSIAWVTTTGTVPTINSIARFDRIPDITPGVFDSLIGIAKLNNDVMQIVSIDNTLFDIHTQNVADNNFIGFAETTVTSGNDVQVNLLIDSNQTGLTAGTKYWLGANGALSTTGMKAAGTALSTTKIIK